MANQVTRPMTMTHASLFGSKDQLMVPGWIPKGDHAYSHPISTLLSLSSPVSRDMPGALRTARLPSHAPGRIAGQQREWYVCFSQDGMVS